MPVCGYLKLVTSLGIHQERIYVDEVGARKEEIAALRGLDEQGYR
jgi:hypothetical protein